MPDFSKNNILEAYNIKQEEFETQVAEDDKKFAELLNKDVHNRPNLKPYKEILDMLSNPEKPESVRMAHLIKLINSYVTYQMTKTALRDALMPAISEPMHQIAQQHTQRIMQGIDQWLASAKAEESGAPEDTDKVVELPTEKK